MKKIIRLTESDLHRIVENSVKRIIREYSDDPVQRQQELDAWDEYDNMNKRDMGEDEYNAELDRNLNTNDWRDMASAYSQMDDPMIRKIHGSTLNDRMKDDFGNGIMQ